MEISKIPYSFNPPVEVPDVVPALQEVRATKKGISGQQIQQAETDDYAGDSDELDIAEGVDTVTQVAKDLLDNKVQDGKAVGKLIGIEDPNKWQEKQLRLLLEKANQQGLDELQVVFAPEYYPTLLTGANGTKGVVTLKPNQEYKTRKLDGKFTLVISENVSMERAAEIASDFIAGKIKKIARRIGLRPKFDSLFISLLEAGQRELVNYYSSFYVPYAENAWYRDFSSEEKDTSDREEQFEEKLR